MNNPITTSSISQISSAWIYQKTNEASTSLSSDHQNSSSWRKFLHSTVQPSKSESTVIAIPAKKTTTQGPIVLQPSSFSNDYAARSAAFFEFLDLLEAEAESSH